MNNNDLRAKDGRHLKEFGIMGEIFRFLLPSPENPDDPPEIRSEKGLNEPAETVHTYCIREVWENICNDKTYLHKRLDIKQLNQSSRSLQIRTVQRRKRNPVWYLRR